MENAALGGTGGSPRSSTALARHFPSLDGMRAIGMAAMLMYHGQVGAEGAFLALSQFFTLSGFLVMSILLRATDSADGLQLGNFWGRRYRRLLPASLLTLAGVILYGFTLATEQQVDALQRSIPAAVAQVVNWHFVVTDASYVDLFQSPSPIQHFWSLAIEEQFYLLTPILLIGVLKITRNPKALLAVFGLGAVASTAWMWTRFEGGASIDRLYYGTDTRASEMLVGCVLAIVLHHWAPTLGRGARQALGAAGLVAYGLSTVAFFTLSLTDARMYRGGFFLFSILTAIVILSLVQETGPTRHALGIAPLAAFGQLTYGIYLFHWPLMLALNEDRTGLDGWTLFALQVSITVLLAIASSKFFEKPLRYGRSGPGDHRFAIGVVAAGVLLVVGGAALRYNDVETDLAGLGDEVADAPDIVVDTDGTQVMVIGDDGGLAFADRLASTDLDVVATLEFDCTLDTDANCGNWDTWSAAIAEHDPDVVLFHVSTWDIDALAAEMPAIGDEGTIDWARRALAAGFDRLSAQGATVVWGQQPLGIEEAVANANDPFIVAARDVTSDRLDVRRRGVMDDVEDAAADLVLYARRADDAGTRMLVVGDSVSRTFGYGLERWADATGDAVVWSAGTEGCGVARGGIVRDGSGRETPLSDACNTIADGWQSQLDQFGPDVVLVVSNAVDFRERRFDDWDGFLRPGDADFDAFLIDEYIAAVDLLAADGAQVIWVESPCASDVFGQFNEADGSNALDTERIRYVNETILPAVVAARPSLRTFDLYAELCDGDTAISEVDGITLRPEGIHFSAEGSRWLADVVGPELLAVAGR